MSILDTAEVVCPHCGKTAEVEIVVSVNADRRPDLRQQILDRTFQAVACPGCGTGLRLPPEFIYFELRHGQWIAVHPAERLADWQQAEAEARLAYDRAFGADAPESARGLVEGVVPRIAFGWPALREKLVCADLGLQDTTLELLKLEIIRHAAAGAPYSDAIDLRLLDGDHEMLGFGWIVAADESVRTSVSVERRAYDDLLADPAPYAPLSARLEGRMFVDLRMLLLTEPTED